MSHQEQLSKPKKKAISRREALTKLGKFGVYSAPVVTTILSPQAHAHFIPIADSVACNNIHNNSPSAPISYPPGESNNNSHCKDASQGGTGYHAPPNQ